MTRRKVRDSSLVRPLCLIALLFLLVPGASEAAPSRIGVVRDCNDYRSVYHPGKGGCYYLRLDRTLEAALPQLCSLSSPRPLPSFRSWTDRNYVSVYTGKRGYTGIRIDKTINDNFYDLKKSWCSGRTTAADNRRSPSPVVSSPPRASTPVSAASTGAGIVGTGVTWDSGMHCAWRDTNPRTLGKWRGRPLGIFQYFLFKWRYMLKVDRIVARHRAMNGDAKMMISLPMLAPPNIGDFRGCVAGRYDGYYRTFARKLAQSGIGTVHVRLAAEFNNRSDRYRAFRDPSGFVQCFRRIYKVLKTENPSILVEWGPNRAGRSFKAEALVERFWPGDQYVDGITLSFYDNSPSAKNINWWNKWFYDELSWWASFARSKNKPLNFAEWGINKRRDGFDNPLYIEQMFKFFNENKDIIGYEIYYNCTSVRARLYPGVENPKAARVYRRLWSKRR